MLFLALLALVVCNATIVSAQVIGDELKLDGFAFDQDPLTNPPYDWDEVNGINPPPPPVIFSSGVIPDTTPTQYTGGSTKDIIDLSQWRWASSENIPDKDNLTDAYVALFPGGKLYFGADRFANNGDAQTGFWLFRNPVRLDPVTHTFVDDQGNPATHAENDILILVDFVNGGAVANPAVYLWQNGGLVGPVTGIDALSISNSGTIPSPWQYVPKFPVNDCPTGFSWCFPDNSFFEGGFAIPSGTSRCFSSFLVETRSSQEPTAVLKDFILGAFQTAPVVQVPPVSFCEGQSGQLCANVTGGQAPYHYEWSGPGGPYPDAACIDVTLPGTYNVHVSDSEGCSGDGSGTVTMNDATAATDLNDLTRCAGTEAQFCTTASGTPPFTYTWTKDGVTIPGATENCYTIASVSEGDEGRYCVTVHGTCGDVEKCATLTVNPNTTATDLSDVAVCDGAQAQFCTTASGTPPITYSWTKDGVTIPGATEHCYTIAAAHASDQGRYCVTVHSACGPDVVKCANLTVNANTTATDLKSLELCAGAQAQFCTTASGTPPFTYTWTKDGVTIPGATENCYTIAAVQQSDAGQYCVTVHGACGDAEKCATLTVNPNTTATDLQDLTRCTGAEAQFCTTGDGTPPITYSWTKDGVTIPGATEHCYTIASVQQSDEGRYCVTVHGACGPDVVKCANLNVEDATTTSPLQDVTVCDGLRAQFCTTPNGTPPFTYSWTKNGVVIQGAADSCYAIPAAHEPDEGRYCVTVTGACGPPVETCANLTVNPNTTASDLKSLELCEGAQAQFCTNPEGTPPFTYTWTKDGVTIPGATEHCYTIAAVQASDAGHYCVTVHGGCGPDVEKCADLVVHANTTATDLKSLELCVGDQAQFCTDADGTPPFTYSWTKDGVTIPGAADSCYTIPNAGRSDAGEYCVNVHGACGPDVQKCATLVVNSCGQEFCTFTQGAYGNAGGYFNGMSTIQILNSLITISDPLIVGVHGVRSVTFPDGTQACIIQRLPAGGGAAALPVGLGDVTMNASTCQTDPPLPLFNGKFRNVLLGQVITLALNTRFDSDLGDLTICRYMTTQGVTAGPDGIYGTDDDVVIPNDIKNVVIPQSVLDALPDPPTVTSLLALANRALSGETGLPSKTDINTAVDAINTGFDECRVLIRCSSEPPIGSAYVTKDGSNISESASLPIKFSLSTNYPNPVRTGTSINLDLPERSHVRLSLFDVSGREVRVVLDQDFDAGYQTIAWNVRKGEELPTGVYFYRATARGLDSQHVFTQTRKLLIVE